MDSDGSSGNPEHRSREIDPHDRAGTPLQEPDEPSPGATSQVENIAPLYVRKNVREMTLLQCQERVGSLIIVLGPTLIALLDGNTGGLGGARKEYLRSICKRVRFPFLACQAAHKLSALGFRNPIMR